MILKNLTVEQYRGFASRTPIEFDPSFTPIVGENGVGKTSVLWALRVLLSHTLARLAKRPAKNLLFQLEDITRVGLTFVRKRQLASIPRAQQRRASPRRMRPSSCQAPARMGDRASTPSTRLTSTNLVWLALCNRPRCHCGSPIHLTRKKSA